MTQETWFLYSVAIGITGFMLGMWIWVKISDARGKHATPSAARKVATGDNR